MHVLVYESWSKCNYDLITESWHDTNTQQRKKQTNYAFSLHSRYIGFLLVNGFICIILEEQSFVFQIAVLGNEFLKSHLWTIALFDGFSNHVDIEHCHSFMVSTRYLNWNAFTLMLCIFYAVIFTISIEPFRSQLVTFQWKVIRKILK